MKVNWYNVKKLAALMICALIPFMCFIFMLQAFLNLIIAFIGTLAVSFACIFFAGRMLRHEYSVLVEGSGIQIFDLNSSGVIGSYCANMPVPPTITARLGKRQYTDVYERELVHTIVAPQAGVLVNAIEVDNQFFEVIKKLAEQKGMQSIQVMKMPKKDDFNKLFTFGGKPTFIFNRYLDMFLGKDMLSKLETDSTLLHAINHLISRAKRLSEDVDPFARYVIELIHPKGSWLSGKLKWIIIGIIIVMIVIFLAMFLPNIIGTFTGGAKQAAETPAKTTIRIILNRWF